MIVKFRQIPGIGLTTISFSNFDFKQQFDTDLRFSESFSFSFPLKVKDLEIFQKNICYDYVTCAHGNAQQTTVHVVRSKIGKVENSFQIRHIFESPRPRGWS